MVNSNANAIGIIFPNSYDNLPELAGDRLMASIPFAGRYRIIDFLLSSLANCGISNIAIVVRENYHSLDGLRTSVGSSQKKRPGRGSSQKKRRPQYFSALCGEKYEGLQRTRRGT